jgi:hypothetical protein
MVEWEPLFHFKIFLYAIETFFIDFGMCSGSYLKEGICIAYNIILAVLFPGVKNSLPEINIIGFSN